MPAQRADKPRGSSPSGAIDRVEATWRGLIGWFRARVTSLPSIELPARAKGRLGGPNPGAVVRDGPAGHEENPLDRPENPAFAPCSGIFRACKAIGEAVTASEVIAIVDTLPVAAPITGQLRGQRRSPAPLWQGQAVAEILTDPRAPVSGIHPADQALARAVAFAIALEGEDLPASPFLCG